MEFAEAEDALLSPLDANGRPHFQVIEELGEYDEFPMEMVRAIFEERRQRVNFEAGPLRIGQVGAATTGARTERSRTTPGSTPEPPTAV